MKSVRKMETGRRKIDEQRREKEEKEKDIKGGLKIWSIQIEEYGTGIEGSR